MVTEVIDAVVAGIGDYFKVVAGDDAEIENSYEKKPNDLIQLAYTGLVGISGDIKGGIYITCDKNLLEEVTRVIMHSDTSKLDEDDISDMVGEMANTICGYVREKLGCAINVSVPVIFKGKVRAFKFKITHPTYIIPFTWHNLEAYIVVGIDSSLYSLL